MTAWNLRGSSNLEGTSLLSEISTYHLVHAQNIDGLGGLPRMLWQRTEHSDHQFALGAMRIAAAIGVLLLVAACASHGPPPGMPQPLGTLAIVPSETVPRSNFATFAKGRTQGAATGAIVAGGATAAAVLIVVATAGAAAPYALVFAPVMVAAGGAGGAAVGAVSAVPADKAREVETMLRESAMRLDSQQAFAAHVAAAVQADSALRRGPPSDARSIIEVNVIAIELEGCIARRMFDPDACPGGTRNPALGLSLHVATRLVRANDGEEIFNREFRFRGPRRQLASWMADDARHFHEELARAYEELGGRVADELLLAGSVEIPQRRSFGRLPGVDPEYGLCGLGPRTPAAKPYDIAEIAAAPFTTKHPDVCEGSVLHFSEVDSPRPLLVWEEFPRQLDRETLDASLLRAITDVTYDLKVWRVEDCAHAALAYSRRGLPAPEHRLEEALQPGNRYFWSIRARFSIDRRGMATPWAFFAPGTSCEVKDVPEGQYHRFATPR